MIEYFADIQICICNRTECSASRGFSQSCMPLSIYNNNNIFLKNKVSYVHQLEKKLMNSNNKVADQESKWEKFQLFCRGSEN